MPIHPDERRISKISGSGLSHAVYGRVMRAIVIGGGIGGVTAALALARAGIETRVYEQAPAPAEVGAGISLWGNAIRALAHIGVKDQVVAAGNVLRVAEL